MKVTWVLVLISLLVLCDLAVSAPSCGDNGVQDSYATQYCNCFSGYAPSSQAQTDCNNQAFCPYHESGDTRTSVGSYQPTLYNATFKADRYNTIIRLPLVTGRRNATIRFLGGSNTCGYPGNLWVKKINALDCVDELWGSMPWTSNGMCGFTKKAKGTKAIYSAALQVAYDDVVSDALGTIVRTIQTKLNVEVSFVTQTSVIYSLINLTPGQTIVTVTVLGDVVYDANTGLAAVTLGTSAIWPYTVSTISMFSTPSPNTAVIAINTLYDVTAGCTNVTNSNCLQQYVMRINPNTGCNLGGSYVFNISLACRADACGTTYNSGAYKVLIYDTDVCGVGGVDVGLSQGRLLPFSDAAGSTAASTFEPNQKVYFAFTLQSDAVTISSMVIEKISATASSVSDVLYDLHPATGTPGVTNKGSTSSLTITPAITPASPGVDCTLWFAVTLTDSIASFRVLPSAAATVTISLIVDITYHGNTKRQVEMTFAADSASSSQGTTDIYISSPSGVDPGDQLMTDAATPLALSPAIIMLFLVFAIMFRF